MKQSDILKKIKEGIGNKDPNAIIYLYGSRARGDYKNNSDWDILVISPKSKITFDYEKELHDPIYDIELESGQVISLLVYSQNDWHSKQSISPLFANVLKEGIKI